MSAPSAFTQTTQRITHAFTQILSWLLWILLGLAVLGLGVLLALRFYVVPHLQQWSASIESVLSERLALDVHIGSIAVASSSLLPDIMLRNVVLHAPENGDVVLQAPRIRARLSWTSLPQFTFSELQIEEMEMVVERRSQTQWLIAGFSVDTQAPEDFSVQDWLFSNRSVQLQNTTVRYIDSRHSGTEKPQLTFGIADFFMRNTHSQHSFDLTATPPSRLGQHVHVQAEFSNDTSTAHPGNWRDWSGDARLVFSDLNLVYLGKLLDTPLPFAQGSVQNAHLQFTIANGQWQQANGSIQNLKLTPESTQKDSEQANAWPGLGRAQLVFEMTPGQGKAKLALKNTWVDLPGVLAETKVPLDTFTTTLQWQQHKDNWSVQANAIHLENADLAVQGNVQWQSKNAKTLASGGLVDIDLQLQRGKANRVYRYLPLTIPAEVRQYVQAALPSGDIENTSFKIKGPVAEIPFAQGDSGVFHIAGDLRNARFVYVPDFLQDAGASAWPALEQLSARLVFSGAGLQVQQARAWLQDTPKLQPLLWQGAIPDFADAQVTLQASTQGSIAAMLDTVRDSALHDLLGQALEPIQANGNAQYQFGLNIPVDTPENTQVKGNIQFLDNDVKVNADIPWLRKLRGTLNFDEQGFHIPQAQAQALGGPLRFEASFIETPAKSANAAAPANDSSAFVFAASGQGRFSVQGLRETPELGQWRRLDTYLQGAADYNLNIHWDGDIPQLQLQSDLLGLASHLPDPFAKTADKRLPLLYQNTRLDPDTTSTIHTATSHTDNTDIADTAGSAPPLLDRMDLRLGEKGTVASIRFVRDLSADFPRAVRGSIGIGLQANESPAAPRQGVGANIKTHDLDLQAWLAVFQNLENTDTPLDRIATVLSGGTTALEKTTQNARDRAILSFLPNTMALRSDKLRVGPYTLRNLVVGGRRIQNHWTLNLHSDEMQGYLAYDQNTAAQNTSLYVRLPYLHLNQGNKQGVTKLVEEQPDALPDTDIVIDELRLDALALGQFVLQAHNTSSPTGGDTADNHTPGRNTTVTSNGLANNLWYINKATLTTPEATLTASGDWGFNAADLQNSKVKRTRMRFELEASDIGGLLQRLDLPGIIANGKGGMQGYLSWDDAPQNINYQNLDGQIHLDVQNGHILKIDPGAARLLSLFSLQFIPRLLTQDFGKEVQQGFAFDTINGTFMLDQGIAHTKDLEIRNSNLANISIAGSANMIDLTQSLRVVIAPQIDFSGATLAASAINPALLALLPAQWFTARLLEQVNTQTLVVTGSWTDPLITKETNTNKESS